MTYMNYLSSSFYFVREGIVCVRDSSVLYLRHDSCSDSTNEDSVLFFITDALNQKWELIKNK